MTKDTGTCTTARPAPLPPTRHSTTALMEAKKVEVTREFQASFLGDMVVP